MQHTLARDPDSDFFVTGWKIPSMSRVLAQEGGCELAKLGPVKGWLGRLFCVVALIVPARAQERVLESLQLSLTPAAAEWVEMQLVADESARYLRIVNNIPGQPGVRNYRLVGEEVRQIDKALASGFVSLSDPRYSRGTTQEDGAPKSVLEIPVDLVVCRARFTRYPDLGIPVTLNSVMLVEQREQWEQSLAELPPGEEMLEALKLLVGRPPKPGGWFP